MDHPFHRDTAMKWTQLGVHTVEVCFCSWWSLVFILWKCVFYSYISYSYCRSVFSVVEVWCSWHGIVFSTVEVWCSRCGSVLSVVHEVWWSCCGSVFCSSWCLVFMLWKWCLYFMMFGVHIVEVFSVVHDEWCSCCGNVFCSSWCLVFMLCVFSVVEVWCSCCGSVFSVVHEVWCSLCGSVFSVLHDILVFMLWKCVFCNSWSLVSMLWKCPPPVFPEDWSDHWDLINSAILQTHCVSSGQYTDC